MWGRILERFRDIGEEAHKAHLSKSEQAKLDDAGRVTVELAAEGARDDFF